MVAKAGIAAFFLCLLFVVQASAEEQVLGVYTWKGHFSRRAVLEFEKRFQCRVEFDYFDSNEAMFESLRRGGGYDIITPTGYGAQVLHSNNRLSPINRRLLPNLENLQKSNPALANDRAMAYSVPYTVAVIGIAYNTRMVSPEMAGSWDIFGNDRLANRMTMMNGFRETVGAALKFMGYSLNTTNPQEIRAAGNILRKWEKNLAMFSIDEANKGLVSGKFAAIQISNGDFIRLQEDNPHLSFFVPREGSILNSRRFVVGHDTEQSDLAHAFINFFLDPKIAAMNMEDTGHFMPNAKALELLDDSFRGNPAFNIPSEDLEKSEVIQMLNESRELYEQAWDEVLIGQPDSPDSERDAA